MSLVPIRQIRRALRNHTRIAGAALGALAAAVALAAPPARGQPMPPAKTDAPRAAPQVAPPPPRPSAPAGTSPTVTKPAVAPREVTPRANPGPRDVVPAKPVTPRVPVQVRPTETKPDRPVRPDRPPTVPPVKTPDVKTPDVKAPDVKTPGVKAPDVKTPVVKPRAPIDTPKSPKIDPPALGDDTTATPRPRPGRGDDAPIVRPTNPPVKRPEPVVVRTPRDDRGDRPAPKPAESAKRPPMIEPRDLGKPARDHFTAETVHGVPVSLHADRDDARGRRERPVVIDNRTYNTYASNVARCNGWTFGARWSDCGPCTVWQPYHCRDGARVSFGFGSGFSFGFYYGTSCAPLCASWCNPWWEGYACSWSCGPWYRPACWSPCWRPYWSSCWSSWYSCGPCPIPAWTPCYAYSVYTPVVYTTTTSVPPVVQQPALPNPDAMWAFLADGYDRDAEDGFILLEGAYPADSRWELGQAFARAFRGDTVRAADLFRHAFASDPTAITRCSGDPKFIARVEALERSLAPAASAASPSTDALIALAASQALRGELRDAYLNATTAEAEGDRSRGTAALITWLRAELRRIP